VVEASVGAMVELKVVKSVDETADTWVDSLDSSLVAVTVIDLVVKSVGEMVAS
jgi:hypothetical protein